ncbi:hypothetical protein NKI89_14165 [Mesorhizobium sp. M0309]|uniref:hypothetical protein n=1 Tax=Mesorhizobium sp. M0309 TaxID=2956933 RepID=UPI00333895B5
MRGMKFEPSARTQMLAVSAAIAGKAMMLAASANPVITVFMVFLLMVLFSSLLRRRSRRAFS